MRYSRTFTLSVVFAILIGLALGNAAPARSATAILQFSGPSNFACTASSVSFDASETRDYPAGSSLIWQDQGIINTDPPVETQTPPLPAAPDNVGTFGPSPRSYSFPAQTGSFQYYRVWSLYEGSTLLSRSTVHVGCNYQGTPGSYSVTTYPVLNEVFAEASDPPATATATATAGVPGAPVAPVVQPFSGPGLPGPGARNLVLFNEDTAVLSAPDGIFTGRILHGCQTAFVITTSEDDVYGQLFVMGGWVSLENTRDVPEDYGQPGSPIAPDCVGK